jgi:hypothetical protein
MASGMYRLFFWVATQTMISYMLHERSTYNGAEHIAVYIVLYEYCSRTVILAFAQSLTNREPYPLLSTASSVGSASASSSASTTRRHLEPLTLNLHPFIIP